MQPCAQGGSVLGRVQPFVKEIASATPAAWPRVEERTLINLSRFGVCSLGILSRWL
jgi:hypothetical protein